MKRSTRWILFTPFWFLLLILVLCTLVLTLSPWAARHFGNNYLEAFGLQTSEETVIRLNPFDSTITVRDLQLQQLDATPLRIDKLDIEYALWPLLQKRLVIEKLHLGDAGIEIQAGPENNSIAGIDPGAFAAEEAPQVEDADSKPMTVEVSDLLLEDLILRVTRAGTSRDIEITRFALPSLQFEQETLAGKLSLQSALAGGEITFSSEFTKGRGESQLALDVSVKQLALAPFADWLEVNPSIQDKVLDLQLTLNAKQLPEQYAITLRDILFKLGDGATDSTPPMFEAASIALPSIKQASGALEIARIDFTRPIFRLHADSSAQESEQPPSPAENNSESEAQTSPTSARADKEAEPASAIRIGTIVFSETGQFEFTDSNPAANYSQSLQIDRLQIDNINTGDPGSTTTFDVAGQGKDYLGFKLQGELQPFSENINLQAEGKIQQLALPPLNYYSERFFGFRVDRGQVGTDINVDVAENELNGKLLVHLDGVKFSSNDEVDKLSALDQSTLHLNVALSYLKDKNNNIELKIPLKGNVNDPAFGTEYIIQLVVKKAVMKQAQSYLMNTFVPYANVVKVAMFAGEQALKVRFEDLVFAAGQTEINEDQHIYLQQLAKLLEDKNDLRINACAHSTSDEGSDKETRKQIASARGQAFKRYLVEELNVDSARILLCDPKVDARADVLPRIEIGE